MLENKSLMMEVLDPNPVEIIRFINSFIVTDAIYSRNGSITSNQLLAGKGLQTKWNDFFQRFSLDEQFRYFCIKFIKFSKEERYNAFEELEMKQYLSNSFESKVLKYRNDTNLWSFLKIAQSSLYSIKDWQNFRRIVEA